MSFNTALSGLRAASQDLSVTGNNIANASTSGFKRSRAEFADVYANSILGSGSRTPGSGVLVSDISQQFEQGNISITGNSLDLAISGQGFFVLSDQGAPVYTRSGIFGMDNQGYIVANTGARLQGYGVDLNGDIVSGALSDLRIQTADIAPAATTEVNLTFNLDSGEPALDSTLFSPTDPTTFNWSTTATVYDSLGNPHVTSFYFVKQAVAGGGTGTDWEVFTDMDSSGTAASAGMINFSTGGSLTTTTPLTLPGGFPTPPGADPMAFAINLAGSSQFGAEFAVSRLNQNGYAPGRLSGINIDDTGVVFARYTNGQALTLGQVALANFSNPQGLSPIGNTQWAESFDSGQPVIGAPQTSSLGAIQSGALEDSNVDLSEQLVNLIIAQRNFQANAKTIETTDAITQSIINMR